MKYPILRRITAAVAGALLLTHCAQNPVSGSKDFVLMSEQQEIQQGAKAHKDVMQEYGRVENPELQAYVTRVGKALAAKSHRPNLDWHFTVVDSPEVNAFALPGGYVYITRGIMAYLNSEAELAGVLGHEIGHVTARHGVRQQSVSTAVGLGAMMGSILVPGLNNQVGASLLQQLSQSWVAGYGRDHELESDRLGAEYLAKTSYDPQAMVEVIGVLKNQELYDIELAKKEGREPRRYHGVFDTHPSNDARLKQVVGEAKKYQVANPLENREPFIRAMNGVYFGDSPDQGVVRGNALLHEKLGFAVQFPPGWRVQNQPDRVAAINSQGSALVELKPGPNNAQPMDTLQKGLKLDQGARFELGNVNGNPAAFAAGAQQGKPVLAAAISYNGVQFLLAALAKDGNAYTQYKNEMKAAINSFHAMSADERRLARPLTIRVITAQTGQTMAQLATQSPLAQVSGAAGTEAQLRLMNDLYPSGEPKPGQLLKTIQ
jgi:predicted Zn-dependent protease